MMSILQDGDSVEPNVSAQPTEQKQSSDDNSGNSTGDCAASSPAYGVGLHVLLSPAAPPNRSISMHAGCKALHTTDCFGSDWLLERHVK